MADAEWDWDAPPPSALAAGVGVGVGAPPADATLFDDAAADSGDDDVHDAVVGTAAAAAAGPQRHATLFSASDAAAGIVRPTASALATLNRGATFDPRSDTMMTRVYSMAVSDAGLDDTQEQQQWGVFNLPPTESFLSVGPRNTATEPTGDAAAPLPRDGGGMKDCVLIRGSNGVARWATVRPVADDPDDAALEDDRVALLASAARISSTVAAATGPAITHTLTTYQPPPLPSVGVMAPPPPSNGEHSSDAAQHQQLSASGESSLWVSKHAPKAFSELLSDESVNLDVLRWLREWHDYVLGQQRADATTGAKTSKAADRPPYAVIVGPPGVGKTTLAHVAARHCGFQPVEVNASVQRSVGELKHILTSTVANSKCTIAPKIGVHAAAAVPAGEAERLMAAKCLIIDEMDGIAANVVQLLLKLDIHRPVMCLANNFYAPALRDLRADARFVCTVPPISPQRLTSRLEVIVAHEGHRVPRHTLAELCHISNGDIRCCLNTLQFLCRQHAATTVSGEHRATVSQLLDGIKLKDATLGLWPLWNDVFHRKERSKYTQGLRRKKPTNAGPSGGTEVEALPRGDPGFHYVWRQVLQCADLDTLLDGVHEQYPQQRYADYTGAKSAAVAEFFAFHDVFASKTFGGSGAGLHGIARELAVLTAAQCSVRCASMAKPDRLSFPRAARAFRDAVDANTSTLRAFIAGVSNGTVVLRAAGASDDAPKLPPATPARRQPGATPAKRERPSDADAPSAAPPPRATTVCPIAPHLTVTNTAMDVAPLFLRCLKPGFRVPLHFDAASSLPVSDRAAFNRLVATLCTYGVGFRERRESRREQFFKSEAQQQQQQQQPGQAGGGGKSWGDASGGWAMEPDLEAFGPRKPRDDEAGGAGRGSFGSRRGPAVGPGGVLLNTGGKGGDGADGAKGKTRRIVEDLQRDDLRRVVTHEVAQLKIKQRAAKLTAAAGAAPTTASDASKGKAAAAEVEAAPTPQKPAAVPVKKPPATAPKQVVKKDFFGRPIVDKAAASPATDTANPEAQHATPGKKKQPPQPSGPSPAELAAKYRVKYVFSDGATNAIKRNATAQDFAF